MTEEPEQRIEARLLVYHRAVIPKLLASCLVSILVVAGCGSAPENSPGEMTARGDEATVARVVDGDTIEISPAVDGVEDVRLIGIDTPEPYASGEPEPLSIEASEFARDNLEGNSVRLEFDEERVDDYDRLLAYVYIGGEMFNETLVEEGFAQVATFPPNTRHLGRFEAAQESARGAGVGIWGLSPEEACLLRDRGNGIGGGCP